MASPRRIQGLVGAPRSIWQSPVIPWRRSRPMSSRAFLSFQRSCLALTHMLMARDDRKDERDPKCNIRLMSMRLSRRQKAGQPAKATKGLVPQPQPAGAGGDSSDEEQDVATAILAGQAW
eukprot:scaffold10373_cov95-Phaeocystis_antarctica.AAC.1